MRDLLLAGAAAFGILGYLAPAQAATILAFGQAGAGSPVTASNTGSGGSAGGTVVRGTDIPVTVTGFVGAVRTPFSAFLDFTLTSTASAEAMSILGLRRVFQTFDGTFSITSTATGGTNYLSGTFEDLFSGFGSAVEVGASTPGEIVEFTSDFLQFGTPRAVTFSFSGVSPAITATLCGPEGDKTVCGFTSNVSGNMSGSAKTVVPSPASLALFGLGLVALGLVSHRRQPGGMA